MWLKKLSQLVVLLSCSILQNCSLAGLKNGYKIEDGKVYYYTGFPATAMLLDGADAKTFKTIDNYFGKDKYHVFSYYNLIEGADPATFEVLGGFYSRDKNNGYNDAKRISADGAHFDIVQNPEETATNHTSQGIRYAHDGLLVYRGDMIIAHADPGSFRFVPMFNGNYLAYDRNHVYVNDFPLEGADGGSFEKVTAYHFKDKDAAWALTLGRETKWVKIPGADLATFTKYNYREHFARDKNHVYAENQILQDSVLVKLEAADDHK